MLGVPRAPVYMKMLKSAYGLSDAPLLWCKEADRRLHSIMWKRHPLDKCFYMYFDTGSSLVGILVLHVDDILVGGDDSNQAFRTTLASLRKTFNFGKWEQLKMDNTCFTVVAACPTTTAATPWTSNRGCTG